ncbi:hypothetical protein EPI10_010552 [Gossypium australe]|uniref:Uncharacterized protein n=1 Tax=Gossypium australe TaxID=47621 RepID=A0A5B6W5U6_9ROSI|nr:hypothetical protein EPI10_010552 [Gossypium australe]
MRINPCTKRRRFIDFNSNPSSEKKKKRKNLKAFPCLPSCRRLDPLTAAPPRHHRIGGRRCSRPGFLALFRSPLKAKLSTPRHKRRRKFLVPLSKPKAATEKAPRRRTYGGSGKVSGARGGGRRAVVNGRGGCGAEGRLGFSNGESKTNGSISKRHDKDQWKHK